MHESMPKYISEVFVCYSACKLSFHNSHRKELLNHTKNASQQSLRRQPPPPDMTPQLQQQQQCGAPAKLYVPVPTCSQEGAPHTRQTRPGEWQACVPDPGQASIQPCRGRKTIVFHNFTMACKCRTCRKGTFAESISDWHSGSHNLLLSALSGFFAK